MDYEENVEREKARREELEILRQENATLKKLVQLEMAAKEAAWKLYDIYYKRAGGADVKNETAG